MKGQLEFYGSVRERSVVLLWAQSMGGQLEFYGFVHERLVEVLWVYA